MLNLEWSFFSLESKVLFNLVIYFKVGTFPLVKKINLFTSKKNPHLGLSVKIHNLLPWSQLSLNLHSPTGICYHSLEMCIKHN